MVAFGGRVRQWRDDKPGGLAVLDIPADLVADLGGRRQMSVTGNLNGAPFTGSTMLVAGGGRHVGIICERSRRENPGRDVQNRATVPTRGRAPARGAAGKDAT
jgi:hypothetical protein